MSECPDLHGKYRAVVVNNIDPMGIGRIQVSAPDSGGSIPLSSWAMPCLPVSGIQTGVVSVPPIGAGVWIEYEQGDLDRPIWVGGYWGSRAEIPKLAQMTPPILGSITLQTATGAGIHISDNPAIGVLITNGTGASILINAAGITILNGKGATIAMLGPTIDLNQAALTVGP